MVVVNSLRKGPGGTLIIERVLTKEGANQKSKTYNLQTKNKITHSTISASLLTCFGFI